MCCCGNVLCHLSLLLYRGVYCMDDEKMDCDGFSVAIVAIRKYLYGVPEKPLSMCVRDDATSAHV